MSLKGQRALITGAGRGIGRSVALKLARKGAELVLNSRTSAELEETKKLAIEASPPGTPAPLVLPGDISDPGFVASLFKTLRQEGPELHILVNNAGYLHLAPARTHSFQAWQQTLAVNLTAPFLLIQAFMSWDHPKSVARSVINISSLGGLMHTEKFPGMSAYVCSKFGIIGLTEAMAAEASAHGIRINCIAPGAVDTAMLRKAAPQLQARAKPEDIADIVTFLADHAQSGILNGTTIPVYSNH